jgi:signal transduction histidine kinase
MFKGLQARLALSYVLVILVCLALVGLSAWFLLRGYQKNLTLGRLTDRSALASRLTTEFLRRGSLPQNAVDRLTQQMNQGDGPPMSVYLLDPNGTVVAGSNGAQDGLRFEKLALRQPTPLKWPVRDERRLLTGQLLLYVAEPVYTPSDSGPRGASHVLVLAESYRPARLALGDLLPRLAWSGAVALAISILVAAVMAYSIARPLDRITRAAEEIAAGNYEQQLEISAPVEVRRLAASFNTMARQVQAAVRSQQDLVANVSHELKTPLTSIQGFSAALVDGTARDEAKRQRAAVIIHEEAGRMRRLVEELLDLARLEAGQASLAQESVDMGELLRACAERFVPQAEQFGVALGTQLLSPPPFVRGDADRLGQVLGILVDNAVKHARNAPDGGRVLLSCEVKDGLVCCSVADNGPGIPPGELSRVFERFYQVDKSRTRHQSPTTSASEGGWGLGLAIARGIVMAHGGRIWAESVQGLGTRFSVELPIRPG